jgi:hypothetical protein
VRGTVDDLCIQQEGVQPIVAGDVPADVAELMAVTQRPIIGDALADEATKAAWKSTPSWTLVTLQDRAAPAGPCGSWPSGHRRRPSRWMPRSP